MFGSMGTGESTADGMYGFPEFGDGLRMRGLTGAIRIMTIIRTVGRCMRVTGTMKTMATIITMTIMTTITGTRVDVL